MTIAVAVKHARALMDEWVGKGDIDFDRIHRSMLQEFRYARTNPGARTPENISETRGKLVLLGKVRKTLEKALG